jgi:hypothetical protein
MADCPDRLTEVVDGFLGSIDREPVAVAPVRGGTNHGR